MATHDEVLERGQIAGYVLAELLTLLVDREVVPGKQIGALRNSSGSLELVNVDETDLLFLALLRVDRDLIRVSFPGWVATYELGFSLVPGGVWTTRLHGPNLEPLMSGILDGMMAHGLAPEVTGGFGRLSQHRLARGTGVQD
jgi:hypothetical protein